MADAAVSKGATALSESTSHIPIAQLTPLLAAPSTRSVKAIVTLTWPYSSATGSVAFLLVEPDFRLRRTRGQVRVQFSGSSAKAVAKSGIASGDEVILSLDGVEWVQDVTPFATPGRGVEFDLKFTERLLLEFRQEDCQETSLIDIDHPTPEPELPSQERVPSPEAVPSPYASPYTISNLSGISPRPSLGVSNGDEWSSPAFTKRARISYGSLFDKEYDPFAEEDGSIRGKGRKRTRLSSTWKYQSRSPSPEAEQENTSPEPEPQATPMMTDEGCQTVGLEDGDAAEVLTDFHKQPTNMGSSSYRHANGTILAEAQPPREAEIEPHQKPTDLPMIQTQLNGDVAKLQNQESQVQITARKMPSSPRLQPISSDALPLVSPLITHKYGAFLGMGPPQEIVSQIPSFNEQVPTPVEEPAPPTSEEEQEDLYGASPAAIHGQARLNEFDGFQDPSLGFNALEEASNMRDQFLSEDQYGHWQAANAHLSQGGSPHNDVGEMGKEEHQGGFYVETQEEIGLQNNGFPIPVSDEHHPQQYPDPEEANYSQPGGTSWGSGPGATTYPDLPDPEEGSEGGHVGQQALHPGLVAMSRSGSAQSAAIDLTDSGDEEAPEEEYEDDISLGHPIDEEGYERSNVSGEGVEELRQDPRQQPRRVREDGYRSLGDQSTDEDEEEGSLQDQPIHDRRLHDNPHLDEEDASHNSQDEEVLYEEEMCEEESVEGDEQYEIHPLGFDAEQEEYFDEDEDDGSFDEDMEDYAEPNRPPKQREPVVIDLLSSDDEDGKEAAQPKLETDTPLRHPVESEEDEQSDSDEDLDAEHDLSTRSRNQTSRKLAEEHPEDGDENEGFAVEEDENMVNAEQDDDLPDTGDEASMEDDASDDGNFIKERTELRQDTDLAHPNESLEVEEAEQAVGEVEAENTEEESSHDRHALQEVKGNRELPEPEEKGEEPGPLKVDGPSGHLDVAFPPPPAPPSLFAQMFNLDGANDQRMPSLHRVLSKEQDVTPTSEPLPSQPNSQPEVVVDIQALRQTNGQLPTPEATQLSLVKESSDLSMSSATGHALPLEHSQTTSDERTVDSALKKAPQPVEEDNIASVDNSMANIDKEIIGAVADEETAKATLEETNAKKAQDAKVAQVVVEAHNTRSRTRQQNDSLEPVVQEEVQAVEEVIHSSPRRSHRRGKSTSSVTETPQTKAPTTPSKSTTKAPQDEPVSARTDRSLSVLLDERTTPNGHDASVELAMSALDSPVKQHHALRSKQPGGDMKLKLTRVLRTELSEFTSLKVLRYHMTQKIDVLGIATTTPIEPERAKGGPRHYQITFNITDQSIAPGGSPPVTEVQVFRPYKDALPIVKVGDGILLRNFLVIPVKNTGFALQSTDVSSWAVFRSDKEEEVEVRGPPVEYGAGEQKHIAMLRSWYSQLEPAVMEKIVKANRDKSTGTGKGIGKVF